MSRRRGFTPDGDAQAVGRSRLGLASVLLLLGLLGPLVAWFLTGWAGVRRFQAEVDEHARRDVEATESNVTERLAAMLQVLRERESRRPYFHYQNLYHDPLGADLGASVSPSPLSDGPIDQVIETYFQVDPHGVLTVPTYNDEVATLNVGPHAIEGKRFLDRLRPESARLVQTALDPGSDASPPSSITPSPASSLIAQNDSALSQQGPSQQAVQQVLDNNAFAQNADANGIYNQIKQQKKGAGVVAAGDVMVTIEPLRFSIVSIGGAPKLAALRGVQTPGGRSTQGFVLSIEAIEKTLVFPANVELRAALEDVARKEGAIEEGASKVDNASAAAIGRKVDALPLIHGSLRVVVSPAAEIDRAAEKSQFARQFMLRFVPVSIATLLACGLAWFVVAETERLARQRSQFAASAAHELRTPLAGLRLYAEMLEGGLGDPARAGDYARRIADEAARLGRVVGNMLGFSQLERGAIGVRPADGDFAAWVEQDLARRRPGLETLGANLVVILDLEDAPLMLSFDADALGQIVQNLIDNAEKYSREASDRTIEVRLSRKDGLARLEVRDHGPGVRPAMREAIFRPFVRGERVDQPAGVGLGLSISRALAREHGGELSITSDTSRMSRDAVGSGACFMLVLPIDG